LKLDIEGFVRKGSKFVINLRWLREKVLSMELLTKKEEQATLN